MTDSRSPCDANDLRAYRARWDRAGPVLEQLRNEELRHLTPEMRRRMLDALLAYGHQFQRPKSYDGWAAFNRRVLERFG
jgi:hypothetical protein